MTIIVKGMRANLEAFARFFEVIQDVEIEIGNSLTVTVERETGNARFVQYVAEKYGCSAIRTG